MVALMIHVGHGHTEAHFGVFAFLACLVAYRATLPIIAGAAANPGLTRVDSDLRETQPQVLVRVDTDRAASLGVSARSIGMSFSTSSNLPPWFSASIGDPR